MKSIEVNFKQLEGKIKPMHCVNNGPIGNSVRGKGGNMQTYADLKIPYARLHDANFCEGYGGEWTVDVHRIFCDFNADENDPNSYDFKPTDEYIENIYKSGTKVFYRLGASIEHRKKYGTCPPKDFHKWARICEHIIRHYNQGWADGFNYNIEYWEIWNEPDCRNLDGSNPCWQGTDEQFLELFEISAKHLKSTFPNLKIGGPSSMQVSTVLTEKLLSHCKDKSVPLDFFSFHGYSHDPIYFKSICFEARKLLDKYGYTDTELILNEYNYIRGWIDETFQYSLTTMGNLKGSSFILSLMCAAHDSPLDMLMYYDARPCQFNGLFEMFTYRLLKTYFTFKAFSDLYQLGTSVKVETEENAFAIAGTNEKEGAILLTHFNDDDDTKEEIFKVDISEFKGANGIKADVYLLDNDNDLTLIREEYFTQENYSILLKSPLYTSYLIKLYKLD